jgi:serine/threonine-protein kinase
MMTVLRPGDRLGGYVIGEVIGTGGMAIVYRAEQLSLGREVALKVLAPAIANEEAFRDRFRREAKHVAAFAHPNIVAVHDFGEVDGHLFLAMQLVQGETLAERLRAGGLTGEDTERVLTPIGDALDAAHAAELVHRDVKPQNILISAGGHPYLADFGIAKGATTAGMAATAGFVGTCNYAAPEQVSDRPITPAVDIYALAAIVYECLTGRAPFAGESDAAVLHAHVYAPRPTFPSAAPGSEAANRLIARGMAKQPSERFATAGELMHEVEQLLAALPPASRRIAPAFPETTWDCAQARATALRLRRRWRPRVRRPTPRPPRPRQARRRMPGVDVP